MSKLLNEQGWHPNLIEVQLAHAERNKVGAAYNRAQRLAERRKMMQAWSDYLDSLRAGGRRAAAFRLEPAEVVTPPLAATLCRRPSQASTAKAWARATMMVDVG